MAEPFFDGNVLALVKNGIIQDFFADFNSLENDLVGSIFIGEVDRISKGLNSSFIKLPFNKMGFLKGIRNLHSGDKIILQATNYTPIDKALVVTQNISFKGRYVVITSKNNRISFSRNIKEKKRRLELLNILDDFEEVRIKKVGIIFRSLCINSNSEIIINDLKKQLLRYSDVFGNEVNSVCQLVKAPNALEKSYLEWNQFSNQNIIKEKGCFDHYSIWEQILSLRNKIVDLASGGNLIIEKTQAFVAIDINTSKNNSLSSALKVNIEAIREIPRQLRLRGLGGKIIIETGPLLKKHRKKIEEVLSKSALYSDKLKIVGWSNLGNLELEMPRSRYPLNDSEFDQIEKNLH